ncbi:hypothetical protein Tco_1210825 [Tanacetum coccineum]
MTQIDCSREAFKDDQYILVTQVKQVFYLEDKTKPHWKVVEHVNHKKFSDGGVIVVEDDPDIIHFDNSSDLPLSTSLNDLDNATLHIDGQSTVVDAPPDIIDVPDEDDDIIGDEDALPHDLADSDVEDLINVDDDDVSRWFARSYGGDGGGDDRPSSHVVPTGYGGCFANKGKNSGLLAKTCLTSGRTWNPSLASIGKEDPHHRSYDVEEIRLARSLGGDEEGWATACEYTEDEINGWQRGGKLRGHIPGMGGSILPSRATSRPSMPAPDKSLKSMHRKVDFMIRGLFRRTPKYSVMFKSFESGWLVLGEVAWCDALIKRANHFALTRRFPSDMSQGKICHRGPTSLTEKRVGPTSSPGIITGDCIPDEVSPARIPQRHVAGE